jgi:hypothetical protein
MANGDTPRKGESMNWEVFMGKCFIANAEKSTKDSKGKVKEEAEVYSKITHFLKREESYEFDPPQESRINKINIQESTNPPISNQPIKVSQSPASC